MIEWLIIIVAGFTAGALNAIAGGGSFITLPALVAVGIPPILANATGTTALLPGYIASAWRFRKELASANPIRWSALLSLTLIGGALGALLLTLTNNALFSQLIPWLILFATLLFVVGPTALKQLTKNPSAHSPVLAGIAMLGTAIYGGYFNGGVGIVLLAVLGLLGATNLHAMNGLKNLLSALLTTIAVGVYAASGLIAYEPLLLLSVSAVIGGYAGASLAYRIPSHYLRGIVILTGLTMALLFYLRTL